MTELTDVFSARALNRLSGFEIVDWDKDELQVGDFGLKYIIKPEASVFSFHRRTNDWVTVVPNPREGSKTVEDLGKEFSFWDQFKQEMIAFICKHDPKYRSLKKKVQSAGRESQTALVSVIAAAVAEHIGVAGATLVPLCALVLSVAIKVGSAVFCETRELNFKVRPLEQKGKKTKEASRRISKTKKKR